MFCCVIVFAVAFVCVCVRVCVRACVRARAFMFACVIVFLFLFLFLFFVCARAHVFSVICYFSSTQLPCACVPPPPQSPRCVMLACSNAGTPNQTPTRTPSSAPNVCCSLPTTNHSLYSALEMSVLLLCARAPARTHPHTHTPYTHLGRHRGVGAYICVEPVTATGGNESFRKLLQKRAHACSCCYSCCFYSCYSGCRLHKSSQPKVQSLLRRHAQTAVQACDVVLAAHARVPVRAHLLSSWRRCNA